MRRAEVWQYQIPMDSGVILRNQRLKQREGLFVRLTEGEHTGWGKLRHYRASAMKVWPRLN